MPKSRNRKNHKKKVQAWKNSKTQERNIAMKKFDDMKERMMEEYNKKMEESGKKVGDAKEEANPTTNTFRPDNLYPKK
jgi:hypothetical protein